MANADITSETRERFGYWRTRTFYSIFLGYIFYYFTRKSFTFAMPLMSSELGFRKSELGILVTVFSISYGISKFVCGILGDKSNPRFFMGSGLILTGILNLLFGYSSTLFYFMLFWGLNGWFQGFGWPPCARLLSFWYSEKNRGTWWSLWGTSHNIGGALTPIIVTVCLQYAGWRYALYIPGVLCIFFGLVLIDRIRDTPASLGLPTAEEMDGLKIQQMSSGNAPIMSVKEVLIRHVLGNRYIWYLSLANFFIYIVRTGINEWSVLYLSERRNFSLVEAGATVPWFEMGGMIGMLIAGFLSDKFIEGGRGTVAVIFMSLLCAPLIGLCLTQNIGYLGCSIYLFFIGMFIFGPQMLVGCAAVEATIKEAAGTASGFAGIFAYLGAAMAGYPFGSIIDSFGWYGYFISMLLASVVGALCFVPLVNRSRILTSKMALSNG